MFDLIGLTIRRFGECLNTTFVETQLNSDTGTVFSRIYTIRYSVISANKHNSYSAFSKVKVVLYSNRSIFPANRDQIK